MVARIPILVLISMFSGMTPVSAEQLSLLFASNHAFTRTHLDDKLREKLLWAGLDVQVDTCNYTDITLKRLSRANLVVMTYPSGVATRLLSVAPDILNYVSSGGGLIVMTDECADSHPLLNQFLARLNAEVIYQSAVDEKTLFQQAGFLRHWYSATNNVAKHPVTEGVNTLWYPLADSPNTGTGTLPLKLGSEWTPVILASPAAYYYDINTGEKQTGLPPKPIVAVRDYGKGRIIEFSSRSLNFFHQPYHRIFEGICLDRGEGLRLVENMFRWVAEPSLKAGTPGGFVEVKQGEKGPQFDPDVLNRMNYYERAYHVGLKKRPDFPDNYVGPFSDGQKDFVGLIGLRTAYSLGDVDPYARGSGTVKEYCDVARRLGYGFVAFAEVFVNVTEEEWNKLVAECEAESDHSFTAIPGLEVEDTNEDRWITLSPPRWPSRGLNRTKTRIESAPGYYFGLGHSETVFVGHFKLTPKASRIKPWVTKFYCGLDVFSHNQGGEVFSEALDYYLRAQANNFNLIPASTHQIRAPSDQYTAGGILTHVRAENAGAVRLKLRAPWAGDREVYVSSGPELTQFALENGRGFREEEWRLTVGVKSDVPLKSVVIYDKEEPFRTFYPNSTSFHTTLAGYHDRQRYFVLIAENAKGRKLVSAARYTSDPRQSIYMCTDMQNTLNSCFDITSEGELAQYFGVGYGVTGWEGVEVFCTTPNILPESGIELGYGRCQVHSSAYLPGLKGNGWSVCTRDLVFGTGDCNVLQNIYDDATAPGLYNTAKHTCYTPRLNGINVFRVEHSTKLLNDYVLPENVESQWMTCLRIGLDYKSAFPKYALVDPDGKKTTGTRDSKTNMDIALKPGAYFAIYPAMWGPFAAFPVRSDLQMRMRNGAMEFGHEVTSSVKAGTTIHTEGIFIIGKWDSLGTKDYDHFRTAFGFAGKPLYDYEVKHGQLISTKYILTLQSENGWAGAKISAADMRSDLPINVNGLNEKWDAGLLDLDTGMLRRVAVYEGSGILSQNIDSRGIRFACGNMVTCDRPEMSLNIFTRDGQWTVDVHNPTSSEVMTQVRTAPWLKGMAPHLDRVVRVSAGSTVTVPMN